MVFQSFNLFERKTALENVEEGLIVVQKKSKAEARKIALEELERVGMTAWANHYPRHLSGGQQQRVSIGRAVVKNPDILMCDEPTGALDTVTGREVIRLLQEMSRERKKTVVMVTHNSFFADIADTVIRVKNGGIESVTHNEHPKDADTISW